MATFCHLLGIAILAFFVKAIDGQNQTLRVASFLSPPFLQRKHNDTLTGSNDDFEGYIKDLLDALGYEYQLIIPDDRKYGVLDVKTGLWDGMMKMVVERQVDMAASDLTITSTRQDAVDFSVPFISSRLTILTKLGGRNESEWPLIVSPFDYTVWLLLVATFLVAALVFFLVKRISPYERIWSVNKARNVPDITLNESFWILIASFFHGSKPPAKAVSSRLLLVGWWLFAIAIVASYAANLSSIWRLQDGACIQNSKYDQVEDILENPEFKFLLFKYGATYNLLKSSTDPVHRQIFDRASQNGEESWLNSNAERVEKLKDPEESNLGLVMEGSTADFIKARHCGFYTVGELDERYYGLAFPKGSPLARTMSQSLLTLLESGKLQEIKNRWWIPSDSESCLNKAVGLCQGMAPLRIDQFDGPLLFLLVVLVLALFLSLVEVLCHACANKEPGITWSSIFSRDLKEGCCGCLPTSGTTVHVQTNSNPQN